MEFGGFGRNSGPAAPPRAQPPFGNFPRAPAPSPPFPRSPREGEAPEGMHSPPMTLSHGQGVAPVRPFVAVTSEARPSWGDRQNFSIPVYNAHTHQRPSLVGQPIHSSNPGPGLPAQTAQLQDIKRSRSPPSLSSNVKQFGNSGIVRGSHADLQYNGQSHAQQARSPPIPFQENLYSNGQGLAFGDSQWPESRSKSFSDFNESPSDQGVPSSSTNVGKYDSGRKSLAKYNNIQVPKRTRSPPFPSTVEASRNNSEFIQTDSKRQSPPAEGHENAKTAETKALDFPIAKRTKLPSLPTDSFSVQDDITRESLAKAKRLARFRAELSEPSESDRSERNQIVATKRQQHSTAERQNFSEESAMHISISNASSEYEGVESTNIIVGSCPDMCPESERSERERKGDLDQYERVDGDRNQTSRYLAVKKYNRTAEREAELIRPMPILQKTMDYLLDLLDQCYDDKFLGLYNFLWDRMRAIRMDLRMQHIFDQEAIIMLEQMIRLHIIAMHELCEYTRGEGFSEGFDAHLNIEQMNKTSVELFQLYDDHRKKGIEVPTEKEFRGYYALLKLDKHPGYKVEPAELSLDLAKMTPNMRQTPEIVFARDVARACRTGNFIAFFRLARKASYLQACLMHAHFAKLRTQALAALHSGLQNNQGIPISHVSRWLGMEEENIEDLLEYHGFSIKEFEEPYMVKEGAFLNVDNDYSVKCSQLVHSKKSKTVVDDVSSPSQAELYHHEEVKEHQSVKAYEHRPTPTRDIKAIGSAQAKDDEMTDYETVASPKDILPMKPILKQTVSKKESPRPFPTPFEGDIPFVQGSPHSESIFSTLKRDISFGHGSPISQPLSSPLKGDIALAHDSPRSQLSRVGSIRKQKYDISHDKILVDHKGEPSEMKSEGAEQEIVLVTHDDSAVDDSQAQHIFIEDTEHEEPRGMGEEAQVDEAGSSYYDIEVAMAKLRLILRLWKRRCSKKKELREQKQLAANAALDLLSLGPPIWQHEVKPSTIGDFNIDIVMNKRFEIQVRSRSRLNVSDAIAAQLADKNPDAKCLCWKIVVCSQEDGSHIDKLGKRKDGVHLAAGPWLLSKLMPAKTDDYGDDDDGLVVSSSGLSIWTKWLPSASSTDRTCCLSVVKDANFENLDKTVAGANAVIFLLSEFHPWELQENRLHKLLMSLPAGSHLPLLILSGSSEENVNSTTIVKGLRLNDIDKTRISTFNIAFLKDHQMKQFGGFFSDEQLRQGLQWLARESPRQPVLHCIQTRDLVLSHLDSSLKTLDEINSYREGPDQCISVFNEALDQTMREVIAAAQANPTCWPCPEIASVEESSDEYRAIASYLPSIGWSSAANIASLVHVLDESKLPSFGDDISWLYKGSVLGSAIEYQISQLEDCLIRYFTKASRMMVTSLAMKEARVMLQKCARLELHNSTYYIIPNWVMIFQRAFNWRLSSLSRGAHTSAYILHQYGSDSTSWIVDISEVESSSSLSNHMVHPTLDEMVEVGCSSPIPRTPHSPRHENTRPISGASLDCRSIPKMIIDDGQDAAQDVALVDAGKNVAQDVELFTRNDNFDYTRKQRGSDLISIKATGEADRLSDLLDKCSIMQNMIDEKLAIYF